MKATHIAVAAAALLLAACGGGSGSDPAPVNAAPAVSSIGDQTTAANGKSEPITFSISDEDVSSLRIALSSDNPGVIPDSGLEVSGNGKQRTLVVTPVIDTLGDAFVTVVATDDVGLTAGSSFLVVVTPEQKSMQEFTRTNFSKPADDEPALVNAIQFGQDAEIDDFSDLLSQ